MSWRDDLRPASFRGVPFGVLGEGSRFGRRLAVHEYPGRDKPWVEDLGRATRRIGLTGFLIEDSLVYGGGAVIGQRDRMAAAAETAGPGQLVHPTLGELNVSCETVDISARWDAGRYFELSFAFIEAGERTFPTVTTATGDMTASAADDADDAAADDFSDRADDDLEDGSAVSDQAGATTQAWAASVAARSGDATSSLKLASTLQGAFGRYAGGRLAGGFGGVGALAAPTSISQLVSAAAGARAGVTQALSALSSAVGGLGL